MKRWQIGVAMAVLLVGAGVGFAEEPGQSIMEGPIKKLSRGVANILTGPGEMFRLTSMVGRRDGYIAASTVGIAQGLWRTLLREVAGVYEVLTFWGPIPEDYQPLIMPEFVYAHGDWVQDGN
jgi:putative exosortase-associated protein (TIGR04073 family)